MSRNIIIYPNRGTTGSGSEPYISFSGASAGTINLVVEDQGDLVYEGDTGALFSISDNKDGLLHSVNDVSGLAILAVYDDNRVQLGKWDDLAQIIVDNKTFIGGVTASTSSLFHISGGTLTYKDGNQASGYVLTSDASGVATWQAASGGGGFTGNTSGDCITDLWVTNIHSCSPLNINPGDEGNVYIGSSSGFTYDITNNRLGIGISTPTAKLHVDNGDVRFQGTSDDNLFFADWSTDRVGIGTNSTVSGYKLTVDGGIFVNGSHNTRVDGNALANLLYIDGTNNVIGMGGTTGVGGYTLSVVGGLFVSSAGDFRVDTAAGGSNYGIFVDSSESHVQVRNGNTMTVGSSATGSGGSFVVYGQGSDVVNFYTQSTAERAFEINSDGLTSLSDYSTNTHEANSLLTLQVGNSTTKRAHLRLTPRTVAHASGITASEGMITFVSDTDATFTSVGGWIYQSGSWEPLVSAGGTDTNGMFDSSNNGATWGVNIFAISANTSMTTGDNDFEYTLGTGGTLTFNSTAASGSRNIEVIGGLSFKGASDSYIGDVGLVNDGIWLDKATLTTANVSIQGLGNDNYYNVPTSGIHVWRTNNASVDMKLTSTGLGIGVPYATPILGKLHVDNGDVKFEGTSETNLFFADWNIDTLQLGGRFGTTIIGERGAGSGTNTLGHVRFERINFGGIDSRVITGYRSTDDTVRWQLDTYTTGTRLYLNSDNANRKIYWTSVQSDTSIHTNPVTFGNPNALGTGVSLWGVNSPMTLEGYSGVIGSEKRVYELKSHLNSGADGQAGRLSLYNNNTATERTYLNLTASATAGAKNYMFNELGVGFDDSTATGITSTLTVNGDIKVDDGNAQIGYVLTATDSGGTATWQAASGGGGTVNKYSDSSAYTGSVTKNHNHALNDTAVIVQVYDNSGNQVGAQIRRVDANNVEVTVATTGTYQTVIMA